MEIILAVVGEFLENLEFLLLGSANPLKRAAYFGVIFEQTPTYQELLSGNVRLAPYFELIDDAGSSDPATVSCSGVRWKQIFDSLSLTYEKLTKLGFTYYNGKVAIIESSEEDSSV